MDGASGKLDAVFLGADVGRKFDFMSAAFQFLRERRGREEMPAGAPRREKEGPRGQAVCSLMRSDS